MRRRADSTAAAASRRSGTAARASRAARRPRWRCRRRRRRCGLLRRRCRLGARGLDGDEHLAVDLARLAVASHHAVADARDAQSRALHRPREVLGRVRNPLRRPLNPPSAGGRQPARLGQRGVLGREGKEPRRRERARRLAHQVLEAAHVDEDVGRDDEVGRICVAAVQKRDGVHLLERVEDALRARLAQDAFREVAADQAAGAVRPEPRARPARAAAQIDRERVRVSVA